MAARLSLIQPHHVRAAAAYYEQHPEQRSHSNAWTVEVGRGKYYTPRDLLRQAAPRAGVPMTEEQIAAAQGRWRRRLDTLQFRVSAFGIGTVVAAPKGRRKPQPSDISADNVRAAARIWDKGQGFKNFGMAKKFQVWIDPTGDGVLKPYPVKAIVTLAARDAGKRPLRTDEFAGANDGIWHRRLKALGFNVLQKAPNLGTQLEQRAAPVPIVASSGRKSRNGDTPGTPLTTASLQEAIRAGRRLYALPDRDDQAIDRLLQRSHLPTEAARQIRARLGQGTFRAALLALHGKCVLTGEKTHKVLRAAHIQRWADCKRDPQARLDLDNGLLLTANLDCLFEVGLIAFDDTGRILIADDLDKDARERLGLRDDMCLPGPLSDRRRAYLAAHRKRVGFLIEDDDTEDPEVVRLAFNW